MRKVKGLLLVLGLSVLLTTPVYACTPPLNPPTTPDISNALEAAREAGRKAAENIIIPKEWYENIDFGTKETETETETEMETETKQEETYREMYKLHWYNMFRFWR